MALEHQRFVDALRAVLKLSPLYRPESPECMPDRLLVAADPSGRRGCALESVARGDRVQGHVLPVDRVLTNPRRWSLRGMHEHRAAGKGFGHA